MPQLQKVLRELIRMANIASISSWMKHFRGEEEKKEKFRLIPLSKLADDKNRLDYCSTNNNSSGNMNEIIKKTTKTDEERRKKIEVRVAAARMLQRMSEQGQIAKEDAQSSGHC